MEKEKVHQQEVKEIEPKKEISRRQALKAMGIGGLLIAGHSILGGTLKAFAETKPLETQAEPQTKAVKSTADASITVSSVSELKSIAHTAIKDRQVAFVSGYDFAGDGGHKQMIYIESSVSNENGGTVHKPTSLASTDHGAWHVLHNGTGFFSWFGILDESKPADNALDCLVNDLSLRRIEATSDLLMIKRHIFQRSHLEIDFMGHKMFTFGTEDGSRNNPFGATMFFKGRKVGDPITVTLPAAASGLPGHFKDTDFFYVGNNHSFAENEWYFVECDARPSEQVGAGEKPIGGGSADREIQKLVMVTKVGRSAADTEYVEFNYIAAWELQQGRTVTYQKIKPVENVHVYNLKFEGQGHSDISGTNPLAHEFCVNCNVINVQATKLFWPLDIRRYCTSYQITNCELNNPNDVIFGGVGYLAQQIGCLYAHVTDCRATNCRHLNDFTGCAYSKVENCHCTGDENGAFVTHGQYDHDLNYIGNSGFLSFANSAANANSPHTWGGWHRRITVKQHNACRVVFHFKMNRVSDFTLEDCYVHRDVSRYGGNAGSVWANADGLVMKNCTINGMLTLGQDSMVSNRPNIIEGCSITMMDGLYLMRHRSSGFGVKTDLHFKNCNFYNIGQNYMDMGKKVTFENCHFYADTNAAKSRINIECEEVQFIGGGVHGVCIAFDIGGTSTEADVGDQKMVVSGGTVFDGSNPDGAYIDVKNQNMLTFDWNGAKVNTASGMDLIRTKSGGKSAYRFVGCEFADTNFTIPDAQIAVGSYVQIISCLMKNTTITPPTAAHAAVTDVSGNLQV